MRITRFKCKVYYTNFKIMLSNKKVILALDECYSSSTDIIHKKIEILNRISAIHPLSKYTISYIQRYLIPVYKNS